MSLFFRPVPGGNGLSEMWGRCDYCFSSLPWADFDYYEHESKPTIYICVNCSRSNAYVYLELMKRGYKAPER